MARLTVGGCRRWCIAFGLIALTAGSMPRGQAGNTQQTTIRPMDGVVEFFESLTQEEQKALSGSAQNLFQVARKWDQLEEMVETGSPRSERPLAGSSLSRSRSELSEREMDQSDLTPVSDPSADFNFSVMTGFTQSETSTAWCGNNVVVGFNDSGSLPESILTGPGGASFNGVARSNDRGRSFVDAGFLNPGSSVFDILAGDPVVACTNEFTFYYSSIFMTSEVTGTTRTFFSAISVSKSTDAGVTFGDPVPAAKKLSPTHFLDKDWMAVDPANPNRVYVAYTDFDGSGGRDSPVAADCPVGRARRAIEFVRSLDGGMTWSAPLILSEVCAPDFVQGSQIAVGPAGEVYVSWSNFQNGFFGPRQLRVRRSNDAGLTFGSPVKIADLIPVGDGFALQGNFRDFLTGSLAVDRSTGPTRGHVYMAWDDGRNLRVPDFGASPLDYGYADILLSRSADGGATWSMPVTVNKNREPLADGRGTDQYQAGVAVDPDGAVGVCFYDRQKDRRNFLVGRSCAISRNGGITWRQEDVIEDPFVPIHATDSFVNTLYLGDYDSLASDTMRRNRGFVGAFQFISGRGFVPNPDVKAVQIPRNGQDE